MNWKEFKNYVENEGVTDDMDIFFMEFFHVIDVDDMDVEFYEDGSFSVDE